MLTSKWFWDFFPEEKLLLFQVDSLLCGSHIGEFLAYDYVGAPCVSADERYIANGGLSLRSRSKVLECLASHPYTGGQEDVYFTHAMRRNEIRPEPPGAEPARPEAQSRRCRDA